MNLYQIHAQMRQMLELLEGHGDAVNPALEQDFANLQLEGEQKIKSIVGIIREEEDRQELIAKEVKRLKDLSAVAEKKVEWLRGYLGICIGVGEKYDGGTFKLSWRTSESVEADIDSLPEAYIRTKIEKFPDKIQIKDDIKAGAEIPGAQLVRKMNLQIK